MTYRCRTCKKMVRHSKDITDCCKNPQYQKLQTTHLIHELGEGEPYASGALTSRHKLLNEEVVKKFPMRLCCNAVVQVDTAASTLPLAVTCLDCLEYINSIHKTVQGELDFTKE